MCSLPSTTTPLRGSLGNSSNSTGKVVVHVRSRRDLAFTLCWNNRVSDASGKLEVKQAGSFPLKKELLDTKVRHLFLDITSNNLSMCRMPLSWIQAQVVSLSGWVEEPPRMRKKLLSRMLW